MRIHSIPECSGQDTDGLNIGKLTRFDKLYHSEDADWLGAGRPESRGKPGCADKDAQVYSHFRNQ